MNLARDSPVLVAEAWGPREAERLIQGLRELEIDITPAQVDNLQSYAGLLLKWNRTYNLLGAPTARVVAERHLLDSAAILPVLDRWLPQGETVLMDVGSGAGLPGIVLAIMREQLRIILIEPIGKKAAFLRQAVAQCKLSLVRVLEGKVQDLNLEQDLRLARTPHFVCRAFASLDRFTALCAPHLAEGSLLFAMKAARAGEEIARLHGSVEVLAVERLRSVEKNIQRNLVVMRATSARTAQI